MGAIIRVCFILSFSLVLVQLFGGIKPAEAKSQIPQCNKLLASDETAMAHLGPLHLGMSKQEAIAVLGKPPKREQYMTVNGFLQGGWTYPDRALRLGWVATSGFPNEKDGPYRLIEITIEAPSSFQTLQKIGIGSAYKDVKRAYGCIEYKGEQEPGWFVADTPILLKIKFLDKKAVELYLGEEP